MNLIENTIDKYESRCGTQDEDLPICQCNGAINITILQTTRHLENLSPSAQDLILSSEMLTSTWSKLNLSQL